MNKRTYIAIYCLCCVLGCTNQPHSKSVVAHAEVNTCDSITSVTETEQELDYTNKEDHVDEAIRVEDLVYDTICMDTPIHIPPFYISEICPNFDAQCCDAYAETCCFVELPAESFYDSIQALCLHGTVVLEDCELGYMFNKWTDKGWVKSNNANRFVYVEPVEHGDAAKFFHFIRGEKMFYCYTHYSEEAQIMKVKQQESLK